MKPKGEPALKKLLLSTIAAVAISTAPAHAAFILIDDSDPFTITITAGDFEEGFSVNGGLLTTGLGNSGSVTLPDGVVHSLLGRWIDLGQTVPGGGFIFFAVPGAPDNVTSGVGFSFDTDGAIGLLSGSFVGFDGGVFAFASGAFPQDGRTEVSGAPFLSISFTSEAAAVPVPTSLALFGAGLAGLGLLRRRS
jgi:hypothetical protein